MKRVLLTGATGFIGRHAVAPLLATGYEVHVVTSAVPPLISASVVWHRVDLMDSAATRELLGAVAPTHLLHFAWYAVPGLYWTAPENFRWVQASLDLLQAFSEHGGQRVVMAGTCAEYDWRHGYCSEQVTPLHPASAYGVCKHALQSLLTAYAASCGLSAAWGRIFHLYGPHEAPGRLVASVIRALLRDEPARCTQGEQFRDFLHVADVAAAFVALLESGAEGPVNIASGQPSKLREVIQAIAGKLDKLHLVELGALPSPENDPPLLLADVRRLYGEIGWRPKHSLDSGLDHTIAWWKDQLRA